VLLQQKPGNLEENPRGKRRARDRDRKKNELILLKRSSRSGSEGFEQKEKVSGGLFSTRDDSRKALVAVSQVRNLRGGRLQVKRSSQEKPLKGFRSRRLN